MKNLFYSLLKYGLIIWILALYSYNSIFTFENDSVIRKVFVKKIEKGEYSTNIFNYFNPYDRKISVSEEKIAAIFAESDTDGFDKIKENDSVWVELYCLESNSWSDFLLMSFNFNYELFSIPDQTDKSLTQSDLIFTSSFWVHVFIALSISIALFYGYIKKMRSRKEKAIDKK